MATMAVQKTRLRSDDIFFPAMALLLLVIVVTGFAQSYFLAGMVRAKLPSTLVHIHGALFVSWILLLLVQASLVAGHQIKLHMTLGVLGAILPPLMVVVGTLTLFGAVRSDRVDIPLEILLAGDLAQLLVFIVLISWGMLARHNPASHKRLMILATMAIIGPAIDRWGFGLIATLVLVLAPPLLIVLYDLWSLRRVHRSTAIGYAMIVGMIVTMLPISKLGFWQQLISWIRHT
jgi:hypothetical protein